MIDGADGGAAAPAGGGGGGGDSAPKIISTPATGPAKSAVEVASDAARAAIADKGSALPANRDPLGSGKFASDRKKEVGGDIDITDDADARRIAADRVAAVGEGDDGDEADGADGSDAGAADVDTEEHDEEGEEDGDGEEGAEGDDGEGGEDDDPLTITLPGRQIGDEYAITVDTPEAAERLRQLATGYMRGNEVREAREEITTHYGELANVTSQLEADPAGFVLENIDETRPEVVDHLVLHLLTSPVVWERLRDKVLGLDDPDALRIMQAEQKAQRFELRDTVQTARTERAELQKNYHEVVTVLNGLVPAGMKEAQQKQFLADARRDLKDYVDRHRMKTIPAHEIPMLLTRRMQAYGINPYEAAARATQALEGGDGGTTRTTPKNGQPPRKPGAPAIRDGVPRKTGKEFKARATARRAASAVPAGGAGSPTMVSGIKPPPGKDGQPMGVEETVAWHRSQLAKGRGKGKA